MAVDKFAKFVTIKLARVEVDQRGESPDLKSHRAREDAYRRHVSACNATGTAVDNIDRVIIEAVEDFRLSQKHGKETSVTYVDPTPRPTGPAMRYHQYVTPITRRCREE